MTQEDHPALLPLSPEESARLEEFDVTLLQIDTEPAQEQQQLVPGAYNPSFFNDFVNGQMMLIKGITTSMGTMGQQVADMDSRLRRIEENQQTIADGMSKKAAILESYHNVQSRSLLSPETPDQGSYAAVAATIYLLEKRYPEVWEALFISTLDGKYMVFCFNTLQYFACLLLNIYLIRSDLERFAKLINNRATAAVIRMRPLCLPAKVKHAIANHLSELPKPSHMAELEYVQYNGIWHRQIDAGTPDVYVPSFKEIIYYCKISTHQVKSITSMYEASLEAGTSWVTELSKIETVDLKTSLVDGVLHLQLPKVPPAWLTPNPGKQMQYQKAKSTKPPMAIGGFIMVSGNGRSPWRNRNVSQDILKKPDVHMYLRTGDGGIHIEGVDTIIYGSRGGRHAMSGITTAAMDEPKKRKAKAAPEEPPKKRRRRAAVTKK